MDDNMIYDDKHNPLISKDHPETGAHDGYYCLPCFGELPLGTGGTYITKIGIDGQRNTCGGIVLTDDPPPWVDC